MAMIQGIDGSVLLNALRQGREDRFQSDQRAVEMRAQQADADRKRQISGVLAQMTGGSEPVGIAGQFASSRPSPTAQPQTFGEAFSPGFEQQAGPAPAPSSAARPQQPGYQAPDPNILAKLVALDPEMGGKVLSAFKTMDEMQLKRVQASNDIMGAAARYVAQAGTQQERAERFRHVAPQLIASGVPQDQVERASADLSNTALQGYMALAIDYDKMIDNELAERQFQAGKTVAVQPGGNVAIVKPDGSARWAIGGGPEQPADSTPARVATPDDYNRLPPGAQYYDPNGNLRQKPGGQTGSAPSGNFPPGP